MFFVLRQEALWTYLIWGENAYRVKSHWRLDHWTVLEGESGLGVLQHPSLPQVWQDIWYRGALLETHTTLVTPGGRFCKGNALTHSECSCPFKSSPPPNPPSALSRALSLKGLRLPLCTLGENSLQHSQPRGKQRSGLSQITCQSLSPGKVSPGKGQELQPTRRNMAVRAFTVWAPGFHQAPCE